MLEFRARQDLPTVLLIDDDLVSREVIATLLTMSGYTLHTAEGGAAALDMLTIGAFVPRAILMDSQMPGLSGVSLIAELRARINAIVIVISGSAPADEIVAAADGFLLKPFGAETLNKLLQELERQPAPPTAPVVSYESAPEKTRRPSTKPRKLAARDKKNSQSAWEPVQSTDEPVFSAETLAQLRDMMPEAAVRQIFTAIVIDLAARLKALESAIPRGDGAEIHRIGHAIKGGCGMAGALQAARLGALLEEAVLDAKSNHLDNGNLLLSDLRAAARNLERMLEELKLPA